MTFANDLWQCDVALPSGAHVEYKYVVVNDASGDDMRWWAGNNLELVVPENASAAPALLARDDPGGASMRVNVQSDRRSIFARAASPAAAAAAEVTPAAQVPFEMWLRRGGAAPALAASAAGGAVLTAAAMSVVQNGVPSLHLPTTNWCTFASLSSVDVSSGGGGGGGGYAGSVHAAPSGAAARLGLSDAAFGGNGASSLGRDVHDAVMRMVELDAGSMKDYASSRAAKASTTASVHDRVGGALAQFASDFREDVAFVAAYTAWLIQVGALHAQYGASRIVYEAETLLRAGAAVSLEWAANVGYAVVDGVGHAEGLVRAALRMREGARITAAVAPFAAVAPMVVACACAVGAGVAAAHQLRRRLAAFDGAARRVEATVHARAAAVAAEAEARQRKASNELVELRAMVTDKEAAVETSFAALTHANEERDKLRDTVSSLRMERSELVHEVTRLNARLNEAQAKAKKVPEAKAEAPAAEVSMPAEFALSPLVLQRHAEMQRRYDEKRQASDASK